MKTGKTEPNIHKLAQKLDSLEKEVAELKRNGSATGGLLDLDEIKMNRQYTLKEAARFLGVSYRQIFRLKTPDKNGRVRLLTYPKRPNVTKGEWIVAASKDFKRGIQI